MNRNSPVNLARPQRGAALFIALILLLVITILAVSTMGTSRLELQMAGNTQFGLHAFQAAQSAIEARIAADDFTTGVAPAPVTHSYTTTGASATSSIAYQTSTEVPAGGYSLGAGYQAYHFQIGVTATAARNARSEQAQGFYIVGPGGS
jgi:Tfp pilus assembly protein PilX